MYVDLCNNIADLTWKVLDKNNTRYNQNIGRGTTLINLIIVNFSKEH
jgi:hypothetical protein